MVSHCIEHIFVSNSTRLHRGRTFDMWLAVSDEQDRPCMGELRFRTEWRNPLIFWVVLYNASTRHLVLPTMRPQSDETHEFGCRRK